MRKFIAVLLASALMAPATALAVNDGQTLENLKKQIEELNAQVEELDGRVSINERHSATDRIKFTGDMRVKADSLHYSDLTNVQPMMVADPASGFMVPNMNPDGTLKRQLSDYDNSILYTTRLRLNMKAKVYKNVSFSGRLTMFKNWGDSTGVKVFDGWDAFTMDGTGSGKTSGDWLRVERAYFDWKNIAGSNFYLSIGRRPSTYGPPLQFRENELRGGTPSGHLVNFNFDGITAGYKLGKITGVEGQVVRFCYGQGYESEWGNGELFRDKNIKDTHLGGFNIDLINDGTTFVQATIFRAQDVTDGFKGTMAIPSFMLGNMASMFPPGFNLVSRYQASTNIGAINLAGLGFTREEMNGVNWFGSFGMTQSDPNGEAGMFGGLLSDAEMVPVFANPAAPNPAEIVGFTSTGKALDDDAHEGYSVYVGVQVPAPMGKVGLEYNYGSKYWTPFTQNADDMISSKLATRGHAAEAYYIFDINPKMFIKVGGIYYDYEYTGSGSPVGAPQKVEDVKNGKAYSMLPVVDKAWDGYASLTVKF